MTARPPTSAVLGRKTKPARRTAGLLLILAAETRSLRPTVLTAASSAERDELFERLRDATPERTAPDVPVLTEPDPVGTTRPIALRERTDASTDLSVSEPDTVTFGTERVATRDMVMCLDVASVSELPLGIARPIAPSAANTAGAQIIIAKKHVSSFFILFFRLYHKNIHHVNTKSNKNYFLFLLQKQNKYCYDCRHGTKI
jgi:hypothetical protein